MPHGIQYRHGFIPDTTYLATRTFCPNFPQNCPLAYRRVQVSEKRCGTQSRVAQVKDGVCLAKYFSWLEDRLIRQEGLIDEYKAAEKLIEIRQQQPGYKGNSFETISSTGANTAVIHYSPPKHGSALIDPSKVSLCDSGSQFLEGTTDITRTIHFTQPTQEEINCYTLVLKGNLALARVVFPDNIAGYSIDCLARQYLWERGSITGTERVMELVPS